MTRILTNRLYAFLVKIGFFQDSQYAYQTGSDCTQAILDMALDVYKGLSQGKYTAAGFIDLEGAFDGVWRKGLLYKLQKLGVKGRLFKAIESFLSSRYARSFVNSCTTDWVETLIGVPQGSVLSALLFLVFTKDLTEHTNLDTRYADDLNVYAIADNPASAANSLESDFEHVSNWCKKWRLNANPAKTTCMLLSTRGHHPITVTLRGTKVTQVATQKVLGITLDENLNFKAHIAESATKAKAALNKISVLSSTLGGASAEVMLLLYKSCVLPLLEYGVAIWSSGDKSPLMTVQQQGLTRILGAMQNTSGAAMEVLTGIMPLDIRLQTVILQTHLSILQKPNHSVLKQKVLQLRKDTEFIHWLKNNPIKELLMAERTLTNFEFDIEKIEPLVQQEMEDILRHNNIELTITSENIGSSGTRSPEQDKRAQQIADQYLIEAENDAVIFTDGSALPNPGPCGAGICAYWAGPAGDHTSTSVAVSCNSTSYHGELKAIDHALKLASERQHKGDIHIFSDCQSALKTAAADDITSNFASLTKNIKVNASKIEGTIKLKWIAGHADIKGNEEADIKAKEGALQAKHDGTLISHISRSEAKSRIQQGALLRWKEKWRRYALIEGSRSYQKEIDPRRKLRHRHPRDIETSIHRLTLQHTKLEENLHRMFPETHPSPVCSCGEEEDTVEHFIQQCKLFHEERETMLNSIIESYHRNKIPPTEWCTKTATLLGATKQTPEVQEAIARALGCYLKTTKKKI